MDTVSESLALRRGRRLLLACWTDRSGRSNLAAWEKTSRAGFVMMLRADGRSKRSPMNSMERTMKKYIWLVVICVFTVIVSAAGVQRGVLSDVAAAAPFVTQRADARPTVDLEA